MNESGSMSVSSTVSESPVVNSLHSAAVEDGKDKPYSAVPNGQHHMTFVSSVNTADSCYVDSGPTTPLLSDRHDDNLDDDDDEADASEELSSDSETHPSVFLKHDGGTTIGEETSLRIALQVSFPYVVAGIGMVGAGAVLEIVKVSW